MENGSIFALFEIGENLYSIQYENDKPYAFKQIFDDWNDIEYLFDFFDEHITDLHSDFWQDKFGRKITVEEAVQITRNQASNFETSVALLHGYSTTENGAELSKIIYFD